MAWIVGIRPVNKLTPRKSVTLSNRLINLRLWQMSATVIQLVYSFRLQGSVEMSIPLQVPNSRWWRVVAGSHVGKMICPIGMILFSPVEFWIRTRALWSFEVWNENVMIHTCQLAQALLTELNLNNYSSSSISQFSHSFYLIYIEFSFFFFLTIFINFQRPNLVGYCVWQVVSQ